MPVQVTRDWVHQQVHAGRVFILSRKSAEGADVADNGTLVIYFLVGTDDIHGVFGAACGGDAEVSLHEGVAISGGTALTAYNLNRESDRTWDGTAKYDPTVSDTGTKLFETLLAGGTGGNASGGSLPRQDTEWVFKAATAYMIKLTNRAGSAKPASLSLEFYLH